MTIGQHKKLSREQINERAIGQWENEGGHIVPRDPQPAQPEGEDHTSTVAGDIGDAEAVNVRVRLIAIENILVALLADAPDHRLDLVREMADFISPRAGHTPHRLTLEAANNMRAIVERARHYRDNEITTE